MKPLTIFRLDHDAPSCRQHDSPHIGEFLNGLHLPTPKPVLAFDFKDGRNRDASPINDFMIRIEKWTSQSLGELAPDSRFTGSHKADEIYIATVFHDRILAD